MVENNIIEDSNLQPQGLSEEYIEKQVKDSKYPEDTRRSIRRFYEELDSPAAPMVGFPKSEYASEKVLSALKEKGLDAVNEQDARAANPNTFVVTQSGIHAPFLAPEEALKANIIMIEAIKDGGSSPYLSNPLTREALVPAIDPKKNNLTHINLENNAKLNPNNRYDEIMAKFAEEYPQTDSRNRLTNILKETQKDNPELAEKLKKTYQTIKEPYGKMFHAETDDKVAKEVFAQLKNELTPYIKTQYQNVMLEEARKNSINGKLPHQINIESLNKDNKLVSVFHGGKKGGNAFSVLSNSEQMGFVYGSSVCHNDSFSVNGENLYPDGSLGYAFNKSSHNNRRYSPTVDYGFVYQYQSRGDKQEFTLIDNAAAFTDGKFNANLLKQSSDETTILPHQNKLEKIYIAVEVKDANGSTSKQVMPLELDENKKIKDQRWRDFVELHNPVDDNLKGNMIERRNNVIAQYDELGAQNMNRKLILNTPEHQANNANSSLAPQTSKQQEKRLCKLITGYRGLSNKVNQPKTNVDASNNRNIAPTQEQSTPTFSPHNDSSR